MKGKVLICDDSIAVHRSLKRYLNSEGIEMVSAFSGEDAINIIKTDDIDILILDIMLPGINGLDVCREIRKKNSDVYIMMLSAKGEEIDRVVGLEIGSDEYIAKPFSPKEVSIRIRKILGRIYPAKKETQVVFEDITINPESYQASCGDKTVELTSKETGVLLYLIQNVGRAVSRERIVENVWGYDYSGDVRTVDSLMKRLKKKISDVGITLNIKAIYGVGYRLDYSDEKANN